MDVSSWFGKYFRSPQHKTWLEHHSYISILGRSRSSRLIAVLYPKDVYFRASASGQAIFKMCDVLSTQQLKAYASKTSASLEAQLKKLRIALEPVVTPAALLQTLKSRAEIKLLTCPVIRECLKLKEAPSLGQKEVIVERLAVALLLVE